MAETASASAQAAAAAGEADEARRRLVADFKSTFASPEGARVLSYIFNRILWTDTSLRASTQGGEMSANNALYLLARNDAAKDICAILDLDFRNIPRAVVRRTPANYTGRI